MEDELDRAKTLKIAEAGGGKRRKELDEFGRERKKARSKTPKKKGVAKAPKVPPEELERQKKLADEIDHMVKDLETWRKELADPLKLQIDDLKREEDKKLTRSKLLEEFVATERTKADQKGIDNRFKNALSLARSVGIEQHRLKDLEDFHAFLKRRQPRGKKHVKLGGTPPNPFAKFLNQGEEPEEAKASEPRALKASSTAAEVRQFAKELAEEIEDLERAHKEEKRIDLLGELLAERSGKEHVKARQLDDPKTGASNRSEDLEALGNRIKVSLNLARNGEITTDGARLFELREYRDFLQKRTRKDDLVRLGSDFVPPNPFGYLFEGASEPEEKAGAETRGPKIPYKLQSLMQEAGKEALEEIRHPEAAARKYAGEIEKLERELLKKRSDLLAAFRKEKIEETPWTDPKLDPSPRDVELEITAALLEAKKERQKDDLKKRENLDKLRASLESLKAYRAFLKREKSRK